MTIEQRDLRPDSRMMINRLPILFVLALAAAGCSLEVNEPTRPGGTGIHVDVPGSAVALLGDSAVDDGLAVATRCDEGSHADCNRVGHALLEGRYGYAEDPEAAAPFLTSACDAGYAGACHTLGQMALDGEGLIRNVELAASRMDRACELGLLPACLQLARLDIDGTHSLAEGRADALVQSACHGGLVEACVQHEALAEARIGQALRASDRVSESAVDGEESDGDSASEEPEAAEPLPTADQ